MAGKRKVYEEAMRLAADFTGNGDWASASKAYHAALEEFPGDAEALLGLGKAYLEAGQVDPAIQTLQQLAELNPDHYDVYLLLADAQERIGQFDAAAEAFVLAGNALAQERRITEALHVWERAVSLAPDHLECHNRLAQGFARLGQMQQTVHHLIQMAAIYQRRGDERKARQQLMGALHLAPGDSNAQAALAALNQGAPVADVVSPSPSPAAEAATASAGAEEDDFFLAGLDEEEEEEGDPAEQAQQQALADLAGILFEDNLAGVGISKPELDALISRAIDLQTRGRNAETIEIYRQVIEAGLKRPSIYFVQGMLYQAEKRYDEALQALQMVQDHEQYRLGAHFAMAKIYRVQGKTSEAVAQFLEATKIVDLRSVQPPYANDLRQVYSNVANSFLSAGTSDKADLFIKSVLDFFSSKGWQRRSLEARRQMDSLSDDGSLMSLAEYLETPETAVALTAMALTNEYMQRNMLMTAAEECYIAIQKAPTYLPIHLRLAEILLKQEHTEEAINKYLAVADVYQVRQQVQQAINVYQKVLRLAPMDVTVRARLIGLLTAQGKIDEAMEEYLALADAYYQLAQVSRSLEKYNEALRLAPRASTPNVWTVQILHRMGDIYNQRVDWARAAAAYEELVKVAPEDERARQALVDLYFKQGKTDDAIRVLDELLKYYQARGDREKMLALVQDAVQTRPDEMALRQRLGSVYALLDLKREAITEYDALGEMQLENGLREEAAQTIQKIIELGPDDIDGYRQLLAQIRGGV
ncbi:MAG: tetratricopeptide repeat protein [Anaerolineae bacterium]